MQKWVLQDYNFHTVWTIPEKYYNLAVIQNISDYNYHISDYKLWHLNVNVDIYKMNKLFS